MSVNTDFRLSVGLFTHPKFIKLRRKLGAEGALSYITLLSFVAQNNPDGSLGGMDAEDIAIASGYDGDGQILLETLLSVRLVDAPVSPEEPYTVHDWAEHNPYAASAQSRSDKAKTAAAARWGKALNATQGTKQCYEHDLALPLPSPSPSPSPSPEPSVGHTEVADSAGYLSPLAAELEGFTDDPWTPGLARKPNSSHSRNETQAQSASAEGLKVCGAAAKVDPRQQEIEAFLAEYPHCREVLESRRGDARTSVVGFFLAIVQGWIADPDSIPAKPVPVPRKRTPEELKAIRAQRDKEADDRFWDEREKQTGTPRAELIAEADRLIRERASGGGSENFGWLDKLAPKSVAAGMVN